MAKLLLLIALCVLPAIVAAAHAAVPFVVVGRVYCDTCRAGFETAVTNYIPGAKVKVECKHRLSQKVEFSAEGTTDETGTYKIPVKEDQGDRVCDVILGGSPVPGCHVADPGRDRSRLVLTSYNGMTSNFRYANALGYMKSEPLAACAQVMQLYRLTDDDV